MLLLLCLVGLVGNAYSFACAPNICSVITAPKLHCKGGIIPNGGYCECYDSCAKVEGERCQIVYLFGGEHIGICDKGLKCESNFTGAMTGICVKEEPNGIDAAISDESSACPPDICFRVLIQPLDCHGGIIKNGGFCGCFDACAKLAGEECQQMHVVGGANLGQCDKGLTCQSHFGNLLHGTCVSTTKRDETDAAANHQSACQRMRLQMMVILVRYDGQWFPRCQSDGLFEKEQCNNIGECFCVDQITGAIMPGTMTIDKKSPKCS